MHAAGGTCKIVRLVSCHLICLEISYQQALVCTPSTQECGDMASSPYRAMFCRAVIRPAGQFPTQPGGPRKGPRFAQRITAPGPFDGRGPKRVSPCCCHCYCCCCIDCCYLSLVCAGWANMSVRASPDALSIARVVLHQVRPVKLHFHTLPTAVLEAAASLFAQIISVNPCSHVGRCGTRLVLVLASRPGIQDHGHLSPTSPVMSPSLTHCLCLLTLARRLDARACHCHSGTS